MVTERDREIMRFIHQFGHLTVSSVTVAFSMHPKATYRRLQKMNQSGYVRYVRPLHAEPGVYVLTQRGIEECGAERGRARIRIQTFQHDLKVAEIALVLRNQGEWITERELRAGTGGIGKPGTRAHVPDGVLIKSGKRIAVEVELTSKPKARLEKILRGYVRKTDYHQIWYLTRTKNQAERISEVARRITPGLVLAKTVEEVLENAETT